MRSVPLEEALSALDRKSTKKTLDGLARYGIVVHKPLGVAVGDVRKIAKALGPDHALADALWDTGIYEARLLAAFVAEPARVTPAQMERFCCDFESWSDCDTVCFHLFDRVPYAFGKIAQWAKRKPELQRRAAFALLASVALHDKQAPDAPFLKCLPLIERAASDDRNFVKKAVSWALRGVGRRNAKLHAESLALAKQLAASDEAPCRFIGKEAVRELTSPAVLRKVNGKPAKKKSVKKG